MTPDQIAAIAKETADELYAAYLNFGTTHRHRLLETSIVERAISKALEQDRAERDKADWDEVLRLASEHFASPTLSARQTPLTEQEIDALVADDIATPLPPERPVGLREAIERLRAIPAEWKSRPDPIGELEAIRRCDDCGCDHSQEPTD